MTIAVMLALTRCVGEVFRLHYYNPASITYEKIKPFLLGALITSIASIMVTVLSYYQQHKVIIAVSTATILCLLMLKSIYAI